MLKVGKKGKHIHHKRVLLIVESPSKCNTIINLLGSMLYACVSTCGHIRKLKPVINTSSEPEPEYEIIESKKGIIAKIKSEIKLSSKVLLATDDDREGESIAWHACKVFGLSELSTERIVFHEITKAALEYAVMNPRKINMNIVKSQQVRQMLDLHIGYTTTPILWKAAFTSKVSAGRCQTPALRLIYDRDRNRECDRECECGGYAVTAYFTKYNLPFQLNKQFDSESQVEQFLNASVHHAHVMRIENLIPIKKIVPKPLPFTTSQILQCAFNELDISSIETMQICQKLYEKSLITYCRTNGTKYSDGNYNYSDSPFPHEPIRPINLQCAQILGDKFTLNEKRVYKLIWTNAVANLNDNEEYLSIRVTCTSPLPDAMYVYESKQMLGGGNGIHSCKAFDSLRFMNNTIIAHDRIIAARVFSHHPQYYTEATLIRALESLQIGTSSTYATTIEKLKERKYVDVDSSVAVDSEYESYELKHKKIVKFKPQMPFEGKKHLIITPKGVLAIELLIKHFDTLFSYDYTKQMELKLEEIANGEYVDIHIINYKIDIV